MVTGVPFPAWPAVGSIAAGIGTLALMWFLSRHRGKPGANWFLAVLVAQATWCFAYGISLLVFDEALRRTLETITWFGITWTGITFLAFALEYTGRGHLIRGKLYGGFVAVGAVTTVLALTNPILGLLWTEFSIDPVLGVATASYTLQPWAYLTIAVASVAVAGAVFLLVDTLLSYGPLYRREATAVALSALPPGFALVGWALGVGPVPQLNLAPIMFLPHVVLDAYAFGRAEMFERDPTAIRAAERTALDDLSDPFVVVDSRGRIVRLNDAAMRVFDLADPIDRDVEAVLGVDVGVGAEDAVVGAEDAVAADAADSKDGVDANAAGHDDADDNADADADVVSADGRRTFAVSVSPLSDPAGALVGHTVLLSDVTERERRRQQLEVLNRVLRHNLRNDMGVVHGYAELLSEQLADDGHLRMADTIERRSAALLALGEKARTVETLLEGEEPVTLSVGALVERVVRDCRGAYPGATATVEVRSDVTGAFPEVTLAAAVENLVENALRHHDGEGVEREGGGPWVHVTVERAGDSVVVSVADDGPGVPEHELATIEAGRETALQHGSGLGLWIVHWAAAAVGAGTDFADREPRGTVATLRLPAGGVLPDAGS